MKTKFVFLALIVFGMIGCKEKAPAAKVYLDEIQREYDTDPILFKKICSFSEFSLINLIVIQNQTFGHVVRKGPTYEDSDKSYVDTIYAKQQDTFKLLLPNMVYDSIYMDEWRKELFEIKEVIDSFDNVFSTDFDNLVQFLDLFPLPNKSYMSNPSQITHWNQKTTVDGLIRILSNMKAKCLIIEKSKNAHNN